MPSSNQQHKGTDSVDVIALSTSNVTPSKSISSTSSEAAAALIELKKASIGIGPLTSPSKRQRINTSTGLVHGIMRVERIRTKGRSMLQFEYLLENEQDGTNIPLLVAFQDFASKNTSEKRIFAANATQEKRSYVIAPYNKQDEILGRLFLSNFNKDVVAFSLTLMDQVDSCIFYKVHNLSDVLSASPPTREIELVRFTERAKRAAAAEGNGSVCHAETNIFYRTLLDECCMFLRPKTTQDSAYKVLIDAKYLSVFCAKQPYIKVGNKTPTLNMKGRGRVTSNKNTQLVNQDGMVCIQVAKCDHDAYHLDFCAPFNPFQAFAFGMAQTIL